MMDIYEQSRRALNRRNRWLWTVLVMAAVVWVLEKSFPMQMTDEPSEGSIVLVGGESAIAVDVQGNYTWFRDFGPQVPRGARMWALYCPNTVQRSHISVVSYNYTYYINDTPVQWLLAMTPEARQRLADEVQTYARQQLALLPPSEDITSYYQKLKPLAERPLDFDQIAKTGSVTQHFVYWPGVRRNRLYVMHETIRWLAAGVAGLMCLMLAARQNAFRVRIRRLDQGHCVGCDYDYSGVDVDSNSGARCPECGIMRNPGKHLPELVARDYKRLKAFAPTILAPPTSSSTPVS